MGNNKFIDPKHQQLRGILKVLGPLVAGVGLIFTLVGFIDFFRSFGSFTPPQYFWCLFVGLPLLGMGMSITSFAYLGSVVRYQAKEVAPVAKDTINYLVEETGETIQRIAQGIKEGATDNSNNIQSTNNCFSCHEPNLWKANYCKKCGSKLIKEKKCLQCGMANAQDANFCHNCGNRIS